MNAPLPPEAVSVALLPIAQIAESPSNPRKHFDQTYLDELAESIKHHGLIQPITVRPHPNPDSPWPYQIVVGTCRYRAAQRAGLKEIPAFWRELNDRQSLEIQVIENLQRRDVHPIEEAEGYEQLMQRHGYKAEEIAAKIGKSKGYVYARLKLTALGGVAREAFFAGQLDASTALLIARIPGDTLQKKAVKEITQSYNNEPLSYRSAVNHIRNHFTISLQEATFSPSDDSLVPAAGSCDACPKRSGNAPEICFDLNNADVCTDTVCFDDKKLARRQQLIAHAEQCKIPVYLGEQAREFAPNGTYSLDEDKFVSLDNKVAGDGRERTYREILGEQAPVIALLEVGHGQRQHIVELGEPTTLETALRKAGWQPDMFIADPAKAEEERKKQQAREAKWAEDEAIQQVGKAEQKWRDALIPALLSRIESGYDIFDGSTNTAVALLATVMLLQQADYYGLDKDLLQRWDITLPDEHDATDEALRIGEQLATWPTGKIIALLLDAHLDHERKVNIYNFDAQQNQPWALLTIAKLVDFDPESLRETVPSPTLAAQAPGEGAKKPKGKKTKAKADPAPALPANEPAAPVEATPKDTWPFPADPA